jgi:hypothetical protein
MRKISLLLVLLTLSWLTASARAQDIATGPSSIVYSPKRTFTIPFKPPQQKLSNLQLFVSTDQGRSWQLQSKALPDQGRFLVTLERDGTYWFTVKTIDAENREFPPTLDGAQPSMKVVLDTQPPVVSLRPLQPRGGEVGVSWDIQDQNPDLGLADAVRLEFRQIGSGNWIPLSINPAARQHFWNPQTIAGIEVRLRARDLAGNWGENGITLGGNGSSAGTYVQPPAPGIQPPSPGDVERKFVNSTKITLGYKLKDVGPSGISQVELYYTLDGRSWNRYDLKFGSDPNQKSVTFDVVGEGLYGLTLIARSGVGLGEKPPQTGDRPQVWIEVDTTKPVVQLQSVQVGQGPDKGKVIINWNARDKNLRSEPITLSFSENLTGPWTSITAEKLPNTGRYVWMIPEKIPYQFYLKVEAVDRAGNAGEAVTAEMIKVDLSTPRAEPEFIEPAGK